MQPADLERRRIQNREAQRRFRERHGQRKKQQNAQNSTATTPSEQPYRAESVPISEAPTPSGLLGLSNATTPVNSPDTSMFDYIHSPSTLSSIDFNRISTEPSSTYSPNLLLSPHDLDSPINMSDSNLDTSFGALATMLYTTDSSTSSGSHSPVGNGQRTPVESVSGSNCLQDMDFSSTNSRTSISSGSSGSWNRKPDGWQNLLHIAAAKGSDKIARTLLQHGIDCNEKDSDGMTPLIYATIGGYEDLVNLLLSHGADITKIDSHFHRTALHWAVVHRRESMLKVLLNYCKGDQGVIDLYDKDEKTPLYTAVDLGYEAGVQLLLQFGANVHYKAPKV